MGCNYVLKIQYVGGNEKGKCFFSHGEFATKAGRNKGSFPCGERF
jgi:hypothetical protein